MALVSTSIVVTIGVLSLHFGPSDPPPVPDWLNKVLKLSAIKVKCKFHYIYFIKGIVGAFSNVLGRNKPFLKIKCIL
jgi:hypothetical protein